MREKKKLILLSGKLYTKGLEVERSRSALRRCMERRLSYTSTPMLKALQRFQQVDSEWKSLEREYLVLRQQVVQGNSNEVQSRGRG